MKEREIKTIQIACMGCGELLTPYSERGRWQVSCRECQFSHSDIFLSKMIRYASDPTRRSWRSTVVVLEREIEQLQAELAGLMGPEHSLAIKFRELMRKDK